MGGLGHNRGWRHTAIATASAVCGLTAAACNPYGGPRAPEPAGSIGALALELNALSPGASPAQRQALPDRLVDHLANDAYTCLPTPDQVFARPPPNALPRRIHGSMPHYSLVFAPMVYRIGSARVGGEWVWRVEVTLLLEPPEEGGLLELADCDLREALEGPVLCEGVPHSAAPGVEACPESGRFEAPITRANLRALAAHWSTEAEYYFNRDARHFDLPIQYDFEFVIEEPNAAPRAFDYRLPLWTSCGRTPYYFAFRSGWSLPIVAHEVGHFLGLLDEYEALSGISSLYPKTPFEGSEQSRMGLSMKPHTRLWPLHHYLILRRYHCPEPRSRDPYEHVLD